MAYYNAKKPPNLPNQPQKTGPKVQEVLDLGQGAVGGFWQGLTGKNTTYEQWLRRKKRKHRGFPVPRKNWLQRLI